MFVPIFLLSLIVGSFGQLPKSVNTSPLDPAWVAHRQTVESFANPPLSLLFPAPNIPALSALAISLTGIDPGLYGPPTSPGIDTQSWVFFLQEAQAINFTSCTTNVTRHTVAATGNTKTFDMLIIRPKNANATQALPGLVYFHGGGFEFLNAQQFVHWGCKIAQASGAVVALVDYNVTRTIRDPFTGAVLAVIGDTYPVASRQAGRAITTIVNNAATYGIDASRVFVGGDSAGGHLAVSGSLRASRNNVTTKGLILLCPFLEPSARTVSDAVLGRTGSNTYYRQQIKGAWGVYSNYTNPADNPFFDVMDVFDSGNVAGIPQSLVITGQDDPLKDEGEIFSELSNQAGVKSVHTSYSRGVHDFFLYDVNSLFLQESKQVLGQISAFINA